MLKTRRVATFTTPIRQQAQRKCTNSAFCRAPARVSSSEIPSLFPPSSLLPHPPSRLLSGARSRHLRFQTVCSSSDFRRRRGGEPSPTPLSGVSPRAPAAAAAPIVLSPRKQIVREDMVSVFAAHDHNRALDVLESGLATSRAKTLKAFSDTLRCARLRPLPFQYGVSSVSSSPRFAVFMFCIRRTSRGKTRNLAQDHRRLLSPIQPGR